MTAPSDAPESASSLPAPGGQSLFSVDAGEEAACTVCGEAVESGASALCNECGRPYHLVLTNDAAGKNCGEVWLNEDFMALEFGCGRCLALARGESETTPVREPAPTRAVSAASAAVGRVRHQGRSAREIVRRRRR